VSQILELAHQRNRKSQTWRPKLPDGSTRSIERVFAISVRHLLALKNLIQASIARAEADGLLDKGGAS
jgi:hypothetical protein